MNALENSDLRILIYELRLGRRVKKMVKMKFAMKQFAEEVGRLCRKYQDCCAEVEWRKERIKVRQELERMWRQVQGRLDIAETEVLLALLDVFEVTRDEGMLQEVLDVVSGNPEGLEVSAVNVKLLAYCYYYIEEKECADRAREMMEELKRRGEDMTETQMVLEELIPKF